MADALSELRSALAGLVQLDAAPQLPFLGLYRVRIVSQGIDGRVSLQMVNRDREQPDPLPIPVWCGVPGVSADHTPGQEMALAFAAADGSDPVAFLAAPKGQPGHVPIRVRHEATTEIRFFSASAGVARVGAAGTVPVALGPALASLKTALSAFATTLAGSTDPAVVSAAATLSTALAAITAVSATKLEAI